MSTACPSTTASTPTAGSSAPESTRKLLGIWRSRRLPRQGARQSCQRRAARPRSDAQWVLPCSAVAFYPGFGHVVGEGWLKLLSRKRDGMQVPRSIQNAENIQIYLYVHVLTHAHIYIYLQTQRYPVIPTLNIYLHTHTHTQNTHIPYVCVCE